MKTLMLAMWIAVAALAGCGVTEPDQASDPSTEVQAGADVESEAERVTDAAASEAASLSQLLSGTTRAGFVCEGSRLACLTTFECHHAEGTNIGVAGCPRGTTCCLF